MKRMDDWTIGTNAERQLLRRCRELAQGVDRSAEVILYGSRARGDAEANSDYDLLVLVDSPLSSHLEKRIAYSLYFLEHETGIVLSVQVYARDVWENSLHRATPFHGNVEREGVRI